MKIIAKIIQGASRALPMILKYVAQAINHVVGALIDGIPMLLDAALKFFMAIVEALPEIVEVLLDNIEDIVDTIINGLLGAIPDLIQGAIQLLMAIVDAIPKIIPIITSKIPDIVISIINALLENLPALIEGSVQFFMALADALPIIIETVISMMPSLVRQIAVALIQNFPTLLAGAIKLFMAIVAAIPQVAGAVLKAIPQIIVAIFKGLYALPEQLREFFTFAWNGIKSVFADVRDWFGNKFQEARQKINEKFNDIGTYFRGKWNAITSAFGNVSGWFRDRFQEAYNNITRIFSKLGGFFGGLWDTIRDRFSSLGTKIGDSISGAVRSGINGLMSRVGNIVNKFIGTLNGAIGMINEIPGVSVGKISSINVPHLYRGTVLKKGQVGLLEGSGAEAVVPLDQNKYWVKRVASDLKAQLFDATDNFNLGNIINALKGNLSSKETKNINLNLEIYPQSLTETELNNALEYFNTRLRSSINIIKRGVLACLEVLN